MALDLDTIIFVSFLVINLVVGLFYSRGVRNIAEYAIGNRAFSTRAITTTIIATYIGAGVFASALTESYRQGLYFIIPVLFEPIALIILGYFFVPRMVNFFGDLSIAETMGKFYGKNVRVITAISAILSCAGIVALQFMVATSVMKNIFGISSFYALAISAVVVILYSSFGGIKSVTFTDILQFLTFTAVLPLISIGIWKNADTTQAMYALSHNPLFDLKEVLNYNNPRFLSFFCLALFFMVPACDASYIQRVSMAKGVDQSKKSFVVGGLVSTALLLMICATGVLLLSVNPNLEPNNLLSHIIENYTYTGLKGLTAICIMAVIMSTADSNINTGAVLFMNDVIGVMKFQFITPRIELMLVRIVAVAIGCAAFWIAHSSTTILDTLIMTMAFYMPVVLPPLFLAIFGFYSSERVAIAGMIAAALTCALWGNFSNSAFTVGFNDESLEGVNEVIPGMLVNLIVFIIAHFVCGRPKGFVNLEHETALKRLRQERKQFWPRLFSTIKHFNAFEFCKKILPKSEFIYMFTGMFSIIAVFAPTYVLLQSVQFAHRGLLDTLHYSILAFSSVLCLYSIIPPSFKHENLMAIFWIVALPFLLVFAPFSFILISQFEPFTVLIFLISITTLAVIVRWQAALIMIASGIYTSTICESLATPYITNIESAYISKFKIAYAIMLIVAVIIAFFRPKQEAQDISEEIADDLSHTVEDQNNQIFELSNLKQIFLRNLQHETNTPLTGVHSMSQALMDCYDKLTDDQRKRAIYTIVTSSERLISYANNLIDVSKLTCSNYTINTREVNLSNVLEEAVRKCKRLYISKDTQDNREFVVTIEPDLRATCDEYYVRKSFENIIINAIQYCEKGEIAITLTSGKGKNKDKIEFSVRDSGIGIPEEDLSNVFDHFVTSTKTKTPAGGRGMGLALVQAVARAHKGTITVKSDGKIGSLFTLVLPNVFQGVS